jgi:hypothetical protein
LHVFCCTLRDLAKLPLLRALQRDQRLELRAPLAQTTLNAAH